MNKSIRWILATIVVLGPIASTAPANAAKIAGPSEAQTDGSNGRAIAGKDCRRPLCGYVYNRDNRYNLLITDAWGKRKNRSTWHTLKPGKNGSHVGVRDVDGFWVGPGCKVKLAWIRSVGPGWHKVRDGQRIQVTDIRCR